MLWAEGLRRGGDDEPESTAFPYPRVLDLYAGSGALGIEALSRGSAFADFVESNSRAREAIRENLRRTGFSDRAAIHGLRAHVALSTFKTSYDLILLDPPYDDASVLDVLETIGHSAILEPGGTLVIEHARSRDLASRIGHLQQTRSRHYGTTAVSLYRHEEDPQREAWVTPTDAPTIRLE